MSAESWEALCVTAAGDPVGYDAEHAAECTDLGCCFPPPRELAGLALFARLMALVMRDA